MTTAEPIVLKNGTVTLDPRLDRVESFDPASFDYPVTSVLPTQRERSWQWRPGSFVTNQRKEGACGGHGWTNELMARPRPFTAPADPDRWAYRLYKQMQRNDQWPGEAYEGTSVIAGAKVLAKAGALTGYRWSFSFKDFLLGLSWKGPAVLGIPWFESMYEADNGIVTVAGEQVGGHCLIAYGLSLTTRTVFLRNSWGAEWGRRGNARIAFSDLERLLHTNGEACFPVKAPAFLMDKYDLAA